MILVYRYRLLPSKCQHRALEAILESQRLLYNAALEERIGAYRRGISRSLVDQTKALAEWRRDDAEARALPANLQRATLKRLDWASRGLRAAISPRTSTMHLGASSSRSCGTKLRRLVRAFFGWTLGIRARIARNAARKCRRNSARGNTYVRTADYPLTET